MPISHSDRFSFPSLARSAMSHVQRWFNTLVGINDNECLAALSAQQLDLAKIYASTRRWEIAKLHKPACWRRMPTGHGSGI